MRESGSGVWTRCGKIQHLKVIVKVRELHISLSLMWQQLVDVESVEWTQIWPRRSTGNDLNHHYNLVMLF